jgi:hypothetical protein
MLIAAIFVSTDHDPDVRPDDSVMQLLPIAREMADVSLSDSDMDMGEFTYMLQAAAALRGDEFWGLFLGHLADGEFPGVCTSCGSDLFLVIGRDGYFAAVGEWGSDASVYRIPITPAIENEMPPIGVWMHQQASLHLQTEIQKGIAHIFGKTICPECSTPISVADAITAVPVKDENDAYPIAFAWKPALREIVKAFIREDYALTKPIESVAPIPANDADQIRKNIADYGETLTELPDEAWTTSVSRWKGGHFELLVDLWTVESGRSDLVLSARVLGREGGFWIQIGSVYVR